MKELELILSSKEELHKVIKSELKEIKKKYATPRKSEIKESLRRWLNSPSYFFC
jgi:DNA gyrase/topoisomerase IV subunit A